MTEYVCVSNDEGLCYRVSVAGAGEVAVMDIASEVIFFLPHASLLRALLFLAEVLAEDNGLIEDNS